jgi:Leucine-rich repeat (LRR) protein
MTMDLRFMRLDSFTVDDIDVNVNWLMMNNNRIKTIRKRPNGNSKNGEFHLRGLHLANNLVSTLEANIFSDYKKLTQLTLKNNLLRNLTNAMLNGLVSLDQLDLSSNIIDSIEFNSFESLKKLTRLNLSSNKLAHIQAQTFKGPSSLTTLDLSNNKLETIKSYYFQGLINLKQLDLSKNLILTIESASFFNLSNLVELSLAFNDIYCIYERTFVNLNLFNLELDNNDIEDVHANAFVNTLLPTLYLGRNLIKSFETLKLLSTSTKELNLNENKLEEFIVTDVGLANGSNIKLEMLNLASNRIRKFRFESRQFVTIKTVDLSNNLIQNLNLSDFKLLVNLKELNLSNNLLKFIDKQFFSYFNFNILNFSQCQLDNYSLAYMVTPQLTDLDLSGNNLSQVQIKQTLTKMKSLILKNVTLAGSFDWRRLPNLLILDLSFSFFKFELRFFNLLQELTLRGANISSLDILLQLGNLNHLVKLDLSFNELEMIQNEDSIHFMSLKTLDLSSNRIESIMSNSFASLHSLSELNLESN